MIELCIKKASLYEWLETTCNSEAVDRINYLVLAGLGLKMAMVARKPSLV